MNFVKVLIGSSLIILLNACQFEAAEKPGGGPVQKDRYSGRELFIGYGCVGCHHIPGTLRKTGWVGPPLDNWGKRKFIVGKFPNTTKELIRWIRFPEKMDPKTSMPNLHVDKQDAKDMAEYLMSLD